MPSPEVYEANNDNEASTVADDGLSVISSSSQSSALNEEGNDNLFLISFVLDRHSQNHYHLDPLRIPLPVDFVMSQDAKGAAESKEIARLKEKNERLEKQLEENIEKCKKLMRQMRKDHDDKLKKEKEKYAAKLDKKDEEYAASLDEKDEEKAVLSSKIFEMEFQLHFGGKSHDVKKSEDLREIIRRKLPKPCREVSMDGGVKVMHEIPHALSSGTQTETMIDEIQLAVSSGSGTEAAQQHMGKIYQKMWTWFRDLLQKAFNDVLVETCAPNETGEAAAIETAKSFDTAVLGFEVRDALEFLQRAVSIAMDLTGKDILKDILEEIPAISARLESSDTSARDDNSKLSNKSSMQPSVDSAKNQGQSDSSLEEFMNSSHTTKSADSPPTKSDSPPITSDSSPTKSDFAVFDTH